MSTLFPSGVAAGQVYRNRLRRYKAGRHLGPVLGVVVLTVINQVVLRQLGFDQMRPLFYGVILIAAIPFLPQGLESLVGKVRDVWAGRGGGDSGTPENEGQQVRLAR